jgi:hypothetical protein
MPQDQIHSRNITFHVDGLSPWSDEGEELHAELAAMTRDLVEQARRRAMRIGEAFGVEIRVLEVND